MITTHREARRVCRLRVPVRVTGTALRPDVAVVFFANAHVLADVQRFQILAYIRRIELPLMGAARDWQSARFIRLRGFAATQHTASELTIMVGSSDDSEEIVHMYTGLTWYDIAAIHAKLVDMLCSRGCRRHGTALSSTTTMVANTAGQMPARMARPTQSSVIQFWDIRTVLIPLSS